jgi:hypothetical protein
MPAIAFSICVNGSKTMICDRNNSMFKVVLLKHVIVTDSLAFDAEREPTLPIPPFVGLSLHNTDVVPPNCDEGEDVIEEIACDLKSGRTICFLPDEDYRPESSGCNDWTEQDVRQHYRDWTLVASHAAIGMKKCRCTEGHTQ